jgi:hypothetical protein
MSLTFNQGDQDLKHEGRERVRLGGTGLSRHQNLPISHM